MKTIRRIRTVCLVSLATTALMSAQAGWNFRNAAQTVVSVPLGAENATPFGLSLANSINANYDLLSAPLPAADLAALKNHPPFNTMSDSNILEKIVAIRRAVLESIEAISLEHPQVADCLLHQYRNRRICISFGGNPNVAAEIREDGSKDCGDEAINLYRFPCPPDGVNFLPLYDTNVVRLINTLAHEGLHGIQDGYQGARPNTPQLAATLALTNQCREVEASMQEVTRLTALETALSSVANNGTIPSGTRGIAGRIAGSIVNDSTLTANQKQQKARDLLTIIRGELKPKAEQTLQCRQVYKEALQKFLAGELNQGAPYNDIVKRTGWYRATTLRDLGEFRLISLIAGGAQFTPGTANLNGDGSLRQIAVREDASVEESTFDTDLNFIGAGFQWDDMLLLGGDDTAAMEGVIKGYQDTSGDGLVDEASERELWRSADLYGGFSLLHVPGTDRFLAISRQSNGIYKSTATDGEGFPTGFTDRGEVSASEDDLLHFSLSANLKYVIGQNDFGIPLGLYNEWAEARFDEVAGDYRPYRTSHPYHESELAPAIAELPMAGQHCVTATGTPGWNYSLYRWDGPAMPMLGSAKADANGKLAFHLSEPLAADDKVIIGGAMNTWSPDYQVYSGVAPRLFQPRLVDGDTVQYQAFGLSRAPYGFECSVNLDDWFLAGEAFSSRFGDAFLTGDTTARPHMFWQGYVNPRPLWGEPDFYVVPPGTECEFHPTYNDYFPDGATFSLVEETGMHPDRFNFRSDGSFSLSVLSTEFKVSFKYQFTFGGETSPPVDVEVTPDLTRLVNLPVEENANTGVETVDAPCLVLGGKHYPEYQFRQTNSENDACGEPHWHSNGLVYSLETPTLGIPDSDQFECGHGTVETVTKADLTVTLDEWEDFKIAHIPPI